MPDLIRNFAFCKLTADCSSTDTTVSVDECALLPTNAELTAYDFWMTFESTYALDQFEIVRIVSKSATSGPGTVTIQRAQEGTTAVGHLSTTVLKGAITAGIIGRLAAGATPTALGSFQPLIDATPATLFATDFSVPDGALGSPWVSAQGTWVVSGGNLMRTSALDDDRTLVDVGGVNMNVRATYAALGSDPLCLIARATDANNYYLAVNSTTQTSLWRRVAGNYVQIGSWTPVAWATGDSFELDVQGSQITAKRNGTVIISVADTNLTTGTKAGVRASNNSTNSAFDIFVAEQLTSTHWQLNGAAVVYSSTDVQLTPAINGMGGSAVYKTATLLDGLDITFTSEASGGGGADGYSIAFFDATVETPTSFGGSSDTGGWDGVKGIALHWGTYTGRTTGLYTYAVPTHSAGRQTLFPTTSSVPLVADTGLRGVNTWRVHATKISSGMYVFDVWKAGVIYAVFEGPAPDLVYTMLGGGTGGVNDNHFVRNVSGSYKTGSVATPGVAVRETATFTTASLAANGEQAGVLPLDGYAWRFYKIQTSRPARVRLYGKTSQRDADLARSTGTAPTGDHGVLLDYVTTSSVLSAQLSPFVDGASLESSPAQQVAITVDNLDTTTGTVAVTLTYLRTE